jgi:hypothetical protein
MGLDSLAFFNKIPSLLAKQKNKDSAITETPGKF